MESASLISKISDMADACRFFEDNNTADFFKPDRFTFVFFTKQGQFLFYERVYTHYEMKKLGSLQIVKEEMKQRRFLL